ncbi:hypothetical protein [Aromatoleum petrolei]|uniref:Permease n=1 Tax=Aromatoleum petrolei TaxID=76116 RepID=A0ABX1MTZ8_9RHOO|nr:hypothetical protein [Aromatoleum petrolei]NMF91233.1 hypothetical protein [Aromatoleum petrolei]QTQ34265.1 Uncharacterized protein ToN1_00790 [Aromatoleum petrolei]
MIPDGQTLSYDAAPAFSTPLRFFLTAPLFGAAAGAALLAAPELLESRWTPGALAVTHLIAVGFMLTVMLGALFQVLPVVAGAVIPRSGPVAKVVHLTMTFGALCLAWGLGRGSPAFLAPATVLLGGGLALFVVAAFLGLRRIPVAQATPRDLRIALLGFAVAVALGITLALALGGHLDLRLLTMLKLHIGWALVGGAGVLLAAASWVVVPMFQITPNYPMPLTRFWALGTGAVLLAWSTTVYGELGSAEFALSAVLAVLCVLFAVSTLNLQRQSRRTVPDMTTRAFQVGMGSFIAGLVCVLVAQQSDHQVWPLLAGILILHGGFVSVIIGMMYKIIPFLAWLHLTQDVGKAPNMKKLQPDSPIRRHLALHAVALAALLVAALVGNHWLIRIAGLLVVAEFGFLLSNIVKVLGNYRRARAG